MPITIFSKLTGKEKTENLIRALHGNRAGKTVRVSEYLEKDGEHRPLSEMIYYPDGSKSFHLYNEAGEVTQVTHYDKFGFEIPNSAEHPILKLHMENVSVK